MENDVNPPNPSPRRYDGRRRQAAAAHTRAAIVAAARDLFLARGYTGATMPAIADAAGVALDTVYAAVGAKPVLFRLLIELAISGEDEPVTAEARAYVQAIHAEPDPRRKLAAYAHAVRMIQPRLAPLFVVLREAARGTPELATLWTEITERRASNMRRFVAEVADAGGLRPGVTLDEAADLVWTTNGPEFYLLLVEERGWDPDRFERWLADLWIRMLLPQPRRGLFPRYPSNGASVTGLIQGELVARLETPKGVLIVWRDAERDNVIFAVDGKDASGQALEVMESQETTKGAIARDCGMFTMSFARAAAEIVLSAAAGFAVRSVLS